MQKGTQEMKERGQPGGDGQGVVSFSQENTGHGFQAKAKTETEQKKKKKRKKKKEAVQETKQRNIKGISRERERRCQLSELNDDRFDPRDGCWS